MSPRTPRAFLLVVQSVLTGCSGAQVPDPAAVDPLLPVEGRYMVDFELSERDCTLGPYTPTILRPDVVNEGYDMLLFNPEGRFHLAWGEWTNGGSLRCPVDATGAFTCQMHQYVDTTPRDEMNDNDWRNDFALEGVIAADGRSLTAWADVQAYCYGSDCPDADVVRVLQDTCTYQLELSAELIEEKPYVDPRDLYEE